VPEASVPNTSSAGEREPVARRGSRCVSPSTSSSDPIPVIVLSTRCASGRSPRNAALVNVSSSIL
jgi:hypothetical protein